MMIPERRPAARAVHIVMSSYPKMRIYEMVTAHKLRGRPAGGIQLPAWAKLMVCKYKLKMAELTTKLFQSQS